MKMLAKPRLLRCGSAAIHIRSSPPTCWEYTLGGPKLFPPSSDLPVVMLASVRLEYARSSSVGAGEIVDEVSCGPIAQSQSPPPAVWSGWPMKAALAPLCATRNALQPAGTPTGPITKACPKRSVRMLGSAALLLPWSSRLGLKVGPVVLVAASAGPDIANGTTPSAAASSRPLNRRLIWVRIAPSYLPAKL